MPSDEQHRAVDLDRAQYPEIQADIGEDPARYLDHDLLDDEDQRELVWARIRGIDSLDAVQQWINVEVDLERGPRKPIIGRLNERKQTLEDIGERPVRLEHGPRELTFTPSAVADDDEDLTATEKVQRMRADGGESDVE